MSKNVRVLKSILRFVDDENNDTKKRENSVKHNFHSISNPFLISNKSAKTLAYALIFVQFTINSNSKLFPILSQCLGVSEYNTDRIPAKLGNPTP